MSIPVRTDAQRAQALDRALVVRRQRAQLREDLRDGQLTATDVLRGSATRDDWASLPVSWLLKAVPGLGPVRAGQIMERIGISSSRRLQGLGERQRAELVTELAGR